MWVEVRFLAGLGLGRNIVADVMLMGERRWGYLYQDLLGMRDLWFCAGHGWHGCETAIRGLGDCTVVSSCMDGRGEAANKLTTIL